MPGNNVGYLICMKRRGSHTRTVHIDYIQGAEGGTVSRAEQVTPGAVSSNAALSLFVDQQSELRRQYPVGINLALRPVQRYTFYWDAAELPAPSGGAGPHQTVPFRFSVKSRAGGAITRFASHFLYVTNIGSTGQIPFAAPDLPELPDSDTIPGSGIYNQIRDRLGNVVENAQMAYSVINSLSRAQLVGLVLV